MLFIFYHAQIGAVVVAFDINFNYRKLLRAANILSKESTHFLVTNEDPRLPSNDGWIVPGESKDFYTGVRGGSGRAPHTIMSPDNFFFLFLYYERRKIERSSFISPGPGMHPPTLTRRIGMMFDIFGKVMGNLSVLKQV